MEQVIQVSALTPEAPELCNIREGILLTEEIIACSYKGLRDRLIITDKRLLLVDQQGVTGKKKKFLSIPLNRINAFSVETGGTLDLDCDVIIYVSGMGYVHAQIMRPTRNMDALVETLNRLLF
ncbi:MAG: PH domain-containing protein [Cyanobacteriota bacterium]